MTAAAIALALLIAGPARCRAADEFLTNLHKADLRVEPDERVEYYSRAIRAWRTVHGAGLLAHCHFNRGETHLLEARLDLAAQDLAKAVSLDPNNSRAYLLRGRLLLATGKPGQAEKDLREYASMKPEDPEGRILLGESRERGGRTEEALKDFRRAARIDAWSWRALLAQARVLTTQRKFGPASGALDKAESLAGKREPDIAAQRGTLLAETLKLEGSLSEFGTAIDLYEENETRLQRSVGKGLELLQCREALALAYHRRGAVREKLFDGGGALSDYREACRLGHAASCVLAERLAKKPPPEAAPEPPKPVPAVKPAAPAPKPARKKRSPKPKSDPGERFYGS
ncbi:MAG: tetratricopeptide repeat protein [Elusimicrobia bacterium]|nr:tetratricopeptide repeat protein [Elusimicrobiota bacterium]